VPAGGGDGDEPASLQGDEAARFTSETAAAESGDVPGLEVIRTVAPGAERTVADGRDLCAYSGLRMVVCGDGDRLLFALFADVSFDLELQRGAGHRSAGPGPRGGGEDSRSLGQASVLSDGQRLLIPIEGVLRTHAGGLCARADPLPDPDAAGTSGTHASDVEGGGNLLEDLRRPGGRPAVSGRVPGAV